jgi:hypothetical protein
MLVQRHVQPVHWYVKGTLGLYFICKTYSGHVRKPRAKTRATSTLVCKGTLGIDYICTTYSGHVRKPRAKTRATSTLVC